MSANQIPVAVAGQRLDEVHLDVALDASQDSIAYAAVQGQGLGFGCGTPGCGDLRPQPLLKGAQSDDD